MMSKFSLTTDEVKLLTGTPEIVTMLRNRVVVPEDIEHDLLDWLNINAVNLWHKSGYVFYFLDGLDYANVRKIISSE
jgi:hypothetical protein